MNTDPGHQYFLPFVAFVEDNATMSLILYFENHLFYFVQNHLFYFVQNQVDPIELNFDMTINCFVIFVYLSSLPIAHPSDAPRRRLVVTGDSARIQDETTENSACFLNVFGV